VDLMRGIEHMPRLYDASMAVMERFGLRRWREWLASGASGRVLEIGCGTGRNLPLYRAAELLVAFDPALELVAVARNRAPHARVLVAAAEALPFRSDSFDVVVSSLVLCSVSDPAQAVSEAARAGRTLRALEHVRSTWRVQAWLQDFVQPAWTWVTGGCHPNRRTESTIAREFEIETRTARGTMRRLSAKRRET
jgi:SAM-dependent methyltransferase